MDDNFKKIFEDILNENDVLSKNIWVEKLIDTKRPIVLFGAGTLGNKIYEVMYSKGIRPTCYCDNYRSGFDDIYKLPIISFEQLKENHRDSYIVISVGMETSHEIKNQLSESGFSEANIVSWIWFDEKVSKDYIYEHYSEYRWVYDNLEDDLSRDILLEKIRHNLYYFEMKIRFEKYSEQYFDESIIKLNENEVFIDGGAYVGDTALEFIKNTRNKYAGIFSFEPDSQNYDKLVENCKNIKNIKFYKNGLWRDNSAVTFARNKGAFSSIEKEGDSSINVVSIDNISIKDNVCPTFIKLDIEGAEYEALLGAEQTIKKYKPKLAICVYHKHEDLYLIPKLIKEINSEYKLYLRHYSNSNGDTICYAV